MKTMAEVIRMHSPIGRDDDGQYCKGCNHRYGYAAERELHIRACAHIDEELTAEGYGPVKAATVLIRDLTDPDDCSFDHHGGCQAHGYLGLEIGEMCPQLEAKAWVHNRAAALEADQ